MPFRFFRLERGNSGIKGDFRHCEGGVSCTTQSVSQNPRYRFSNVTGPFGFDKRTKTKRLMIRVHGGYSMRDGEWVGRWAEDHGTKIPDDGPAFAGRRNPSAIEIKGKWERSPSRVDKLKPIGEIPE